jgi:hypothetical protein
MAQEKNPYIRLIFNFSFSQQCGYGPEQALEKAIDLIKKGFSKKEVYTELLNITGVE